MQSTMTRSPGGGSSSACTPGDRGNLWVIDYELPSTKFARLSETWKKETEYLSKIKKKISHPAYQEIILMGEDAIPLILGDLKKDPADWFFALAQITGENPIPDSSAGNVKEMAEAWLQWGRNKGYNM